MASYPKSKIKPEMFGKIFGSSSTIKEWNVSKYATDDWDLSGYCPRVDYAIGPFNIDGQIEQNNKEINQIVQEHNNLLEYLFYASDLTTDTNERYFIRSFQDFIRPHNLNTNPRCFLSIEIENSGGTKHCLGDIINASIIGKVGLVIPTSQSKYKLFVRMRRYFMFAKDVGKTRLSISNTLIIPEMKFIQIIKNYGNIGSIIASDV